MFDTTYTIDKDHIRLSMPLLKVDVERRICHGFATADNVDKQKDIVTKEASAKAFEKFKGNIREQHDSRKAVGRIVSLRHDALFDQATNKQYNGVFVSAYVSKGAEDTWQKVLDGTLTGFSIGGSIKEADWAIDTESGEEIRIVKEYELVELSLVDNPANELASIVSIEKMEDGEIKVNTPLVEGGIENIFWCKSDNLISLHTTEESNCAVCGKSMQNVGFVESNDSEKAQVIQESLDTFKKTIEKEASNVAEVEETVEKSVDTPEPESEVEKSEEQEAETEVELVKEESPEDPSTIVDELTKTLVSSLTTMADAIKSLNVKIDDIVKSVDSVKEDITAVKGSVDEFGERVDKVEDTTAFRKSGDLGEIVQEQEVRKSESPWGGRFLNSTDL